MEHYDFDFKRMNETDIREEIIAPLLRELGYRTCSQHTIRREWYLTDPTLQTGKKKKGDPIVSGMADYVCIADDRVRWVIEAKAGNLRLRIGDERQAWSYAIHHEIRAVYFLLTNGHDFELYKTSHGLEGDPFMRWTRDEMNGNFGMVKRYLSPAAISKEFPDIKPDKGVSLGGDLGSSAQVTSGTFTVLSTRPSIAAINDLTMTITGGLIQRAADGMVVEVITHIPIKPIQALHTQLGNERLELFTSDQRLSSDPNAPTCFEGISAITFPAGADLLNIQTRETTRLEAPLSSVSVTRAQGILVEEKFFGTYCVIVNYGEVGSLIRFISEGEFEISLAS